MSVLLSPDFIPAFKDLSLEKLASSATAAAAAAAPPPPPPAAGPAAPGSSYPPHLKVGLGPPSVMGTATWATIQRRADDDIRRACLLFSGGELSRSWSTCQVIKRPRNICVICVCVCA